MAHIEAKVAPQADKVRADLAAFAQAEMAKAAWSAVPEDTKAYGAISCGAAIGDDAYISDFLDNAQRSLCADPVTGAPGHRPGPGQCARCERRDQLLLAAEGGLHPQHAPPLGDSPSGGGRRRGVPEGVLQVVRM